MPVTHLSLSFTIEADDATTDQLANRLDKHLAGRVKDMIADALTGLNFDLRERYWLLSPETAPAGRPATRSSPEVPVWLSGDQKVVSLKVGSPEWFQMIGDAKKFSYRYERLIFTVRLETRKSKGKEYTYWRAYATVNGKLYTKQLGVTEDLTREALDAVGVYFSSVGVV